MLHRWIAYLGALGCAELFQINFQVKKSTHQLAAVLELPVRSRGLSV